MIEKFIENENTPVPENIVPGRFVQFASDNFDMQEETLDGHGTFHGTQMAVFQRGPPMELHPKDTTIGQNTTLGPVPAAFNHIENAEAREKPPPRFAQPVGETIPDLQCDSVREGKKLNVAWLMTHQQDDEGKIPAWTDFNQAITDDTPHTSTVGYLPIIPAPAHEMDTMMTVMLHCQGIARKLGAQSKVLTLDQALYCKAKQLVWLHLDQFNDVTVRLGGFPELSWSYRFTFRSIRPC